MMMLMCVSLRIENILYICFIYFFMYNLCLTYANDNYNTFDNDDDDDDDNDDIDNDDDVYVCC